MKNKVTIQKIAAAAAVSVATVSRVFNNKNPEKVSPAVRKKVERIIHKYSYVPNIHARGLSGGKTSLLGVQVLSLTSPLSNVEIIESLEAAAGEKKYNIILGISSWNKKREKDSIAVMLEKGVDGIIWQPVGVPNPNIRNNIAFRKRPLVWLNNDWGHNIPGSYNDELVSGQLAFEYLYHRGTKKPVFIGVQGDSHTKLRYQGWCKAVREHGLSPTPQILLKTPGENAYEIGKETIKTILTQKPCNADGAFISGSIMTLGVYDGLREINIDCNSFPIVGHNLYFGNFNYNPIPSICPQYAAIGKDAVTIFEKLLTGESVSSIGHSPVIKNEIVSVLNSKYEVCNNE